MMGDNGEHEGVVRIQALLIEKEGGVQDSQVGTSLDVRNYFWLQKKRIEIWEHQVVELADMHNGATLPLAVRIWLPDDKDWKVKRRGVGSKFQTPLLAHLDERIVNEPSSVVTQRVDSWLYGWDISDLTRLQQYLYPPFWGYLNKTLRLLDRWILCDQARDLFHGAGVPKHTYPVLEDCFYRSICRR